MLKFFVGAFKSTMPPQFHDFYYENEGWVPESIHSISFCSLEHARIFADKLRDICISDDADIYPVYQASCIYPVDVPNNWNGEDVARLLERKIEASSHLEMLCFIHPTQTLV